MSGSTFAFVVLALVLAAWGAFAVVRSTADQRWAEVKASIAAHAEAVRARGATGPPTWTWDIGRNEPVPLRA
jgi:hypothetical protein